MLQITRMNGQKRYRASLAACAAALVVATALPLRPQPAPANLNGVMMKFVSIPPGEFEEVRGSRRFEGGSRDEVRGTVRGTRFEDGSRGFEGVRGVRGTGLEGFERGSRVRGGFEAQRVFISTPLPAPTSNSSTPKNPASRQPTQRARQNKKYQTNPISPNPF